MMFRRSFWILATFAMTAPAGSHGAPRAAPQAKEFELRSRTLIEGPARTVCFSNGGIVLGTGGGIAVFGNDTALTNPSFMPIDGTAAEIIVRENIAYVAASGGLRVLDLSDVTSPKEIFGFPTPQALGCACVDRTLFLADPGNGLLVFDLENPREPRLKETKSLPFPAVSLASDGEMLAVIYARMAEIFCVHPNGALEEMSEVIVSSDVKKGLARDGILYLLTANGEVLCCDFAQGDALLPLKALPIKDVVDFAVTEKRGILLTKSAFLAPFEIERAGVPRPGKSNATFKVGKAFTIKSIRSARQSDAARGASFESAKPTGVFMSDKRLVLISPFDGVRLYAREGMRLRFLSLFATRGFAINLIAAHGLLYVANAYDGVRIGSVRTDGTVDWIGHVQTKEARDVALSDMNLIVADGAGGLKTINVSDPRNPKIIGRHASPFFMSSVAVHGARAYCAGGLGGVEIVDIADGRRPKLVWRKHFSEVRGIWADSRYLYFADGFDGFRIFSLEGRKPVSLSVLDTPGWHCDCLVTGNTAFLADGGNGIMICDVSEREHPRLVGSVSLGAIARKIRVLGKTLFVAADTKGMAAVDVSNPKNPTIDSWYRKVGESRGVFVDDDFVYLASGSGGVCIFKYHY